MKYITSILAIAITLVSTGCVTTNYQAEEAYKSYWKGGANVQVRSEKKNELTYYIEAKGAGASKREHIEAAWNEFADSVAQGRRYEKEYSFKNYEYQTHMSFWVHKAEMVVGTIKLK